jgi:metal-responsive CopG/Arc/MetJ family transcriptional regulator
MKTAISLPEPTFEAATRRAAELGMSRSQFFAVAARRYLDELDSASLTTHIDEALNDAGSDDSASIAVAAGRGRLAIDPDW